VQDSLWSLLLLLKVYGQSNNARNICRTVKENIKSLLCLGETSTHARRFLQGKGNLQSLHVHRSIFTDETLQVSTLKSQRNINKESAEDSSLHPTLH